jgi:hypothetical protein
MIMSKKLCENCKHFSRSCIEYNNCKAINSYGKCEKNILKEFTGEFYSDITEMERGFIYANIFEWEREVYVDEKFGCIYFADEI